LANPGPYQGRSARWFYLGSAVACALIIFAGFSRTFYLNSFFAKRHLPTTFIVHGVIFTSWLLLLIAQTLLVSMGRTDLHRKLGWVGVGLAGLMLIVGIRATLYAVSTRLVFRATSGGLVDDSAL
jgi:hypothetical protein